MKGQTPVIPRYFASDRRLYRRNATMRHAIRRIPPMIPRAGLGPYLVLSGLIVLFIAVSLRCSTPSTIATISPACVASRIAFSSSNQYQIILAAIALLAAIACRPSVAESPSRVDGIADHCLSAAATLRLVRRILPGGQD